MGAVEREDLKTSGSARIPSATYRLQFNAGFTFRDAEGILDYLDELGISDIYASPYFQAGSETSHGYDVANHNALNPSIGTEADFRLFANGLRRRDMGQLLDFVPNHMGISEPLNQWWMDVLEDGAASRFAGYFDIDWESRKPRLSGKVLLPILGDRYGKVLESGDLRLVFENDGFFVQYFQMKLPVNPGTFPRILERAVRHLDDEDAAQLGEVIRAFADLADPAASDLTAAKTRAAGKGPAKLALGELAARSLSVREAIELAVGEFTGTPGVPDTFDLFHELLDAQVYRLSYWRVAAEEINYRRFFDISSLAAIRVEVPEVFEASHRFLFEMLARGEVTGVRIDHVDGLWDPPAYLQRLQARYSAVTGRDSSEKPLYLVVEKILGFDETLPADWPVHGTTGYEFANDVVLVMTESAASRVLTTIYQRFSDESIPLPELVYQKKLLTTRLSLRSEIDSLGRILDDLSEEDRDYRDFTRRALTDAVHEVVACFPVYRTYVTETGVVSTQDEPVIRRAVALARRRNPAIDGPVFDYLRDVLLARLPERLTETERQDHLRFVMRFQQCTGPVMAKGFEDTVLYIYNRLVALNEVGGSPGLFGISVEEFHQRNAVRHSKTPHTLLATSTHDTKRGEDVRMRIAAISEVPELWKRGVTQWSRRNRRFKTEVNGEPAPSPNEEYLLYQTLAGVWPIGGAPAGDGFIKRIQEYMLKALKEAKVNSSWVEPNVPWEEATARFIERILDPNRSTAFLKAFGGFAEIVARLGVMNSLTQVVLKSTVSGVPDFYQGSELWDDSLVDPDNRRPVDFEKRKAMLSHVRDRPPEELLADWSSGALKLFLIRKLLRFRREQALFFRGADYTPLAVSGRFARNVIAFRRCLGMEELVVAVPRATSALGFPPAGSVWEDTCIELGHGGEWKDIPTGEVIRAGGERLAMSDLTGRLPFAVIYRSA